MSSRIVGILPAAGVGSRINLPFAKELLPITYTPDGIVTILESSLMQLTNAGIEEAVIVINPNKGLIPSYIGHKRCGVNILYATQTYKNSREGLPDAILAAREYSEDADLWVMLMPDVYFTASNITKNLVKKIQDYPEEIAAVSVWETDEPFRFGIVGIKDLKVTYVSDKPQITGLENHWGAVAFRDHFWEYIKSERETLSNALNRAVHADIIVSEAYGTYLDCGTPKSAIEGIVQVNS